MSDHAFLHQNAARDYIRDVEDPVVRLLLQILHNRAVAFLLSDPTFRERRLAPFDELLFIRAASTLLAQPELLKAVLSGSVSTIEEAVWFLPESGPINQR